jgi:hypothetical protein
VEAVGYIRRNLPHDAVLTGWDDAEADIILVVTGCKTACADRSSLEGRTVRVLTCEEDARKFIDDMHRGRPR